jgi:hypothetical protein
LFSDPPHLVLELVRRLHNDERRADDEVMGLEDAIGSPVVLEFA